MKQRVVQENDPGSMTSLSIADESVILSSPGGFDNIWPLEIVGPYANIKARTPTLASFPIAS
jgi:hypothetical protein